MLDGPFHAARDVHCAAEAIPSDALDAHQSGIGSNTRQCACCAVATDRSGAMRSMAFVVHRVVVIVHNIIAVVRKRFTTVP